MFEIDLYIDETGTITSALVNEYFGAGFVFCPSTETSKVEAALKAAHLDKIHMTEERNKVEIAERLAQLQLKKFDFSGGATVQEDWGLSASCLSSSKIINGF